ncbi:MAG: hypothetical protein ACOYL6_06805 [Bacteriovoracaceae bacterium]
MSFKYSIIFVKNEICPTPSLVKELGQIFAQEQLGEIKSMHVCTPDAESLKKSIETYSNTNGDGLIYLFLDQPLVWSDIEKLYGESTLTKLYPEAGMTQDRFIIPIDLSRKEGMERLVSILTYIKKSYKSSLGCKGFCAV